MASPWLDPGTSEHAHLMTDLETLDSQPTHSGAEPRWTRPPSRRKRLSAYSVLFLVFLPFVWMLWMTSWAPPPHADVAEEVEVADTFVMDAKFDVGATPRTRVYRWTVSAVPVREAGGGEKTRVVVNGRSPGPLVQANVHDRILVYVTNALVNEGTSIHWHALPLPSTPFYDGTPGISQCPIPPGQTFLYNFTLGGWSGTTWWHGHTGVQHTDGLFGPLVVHAPDENPHGTDYAAEDVLVLSDVYNAPAEALVKTYLETNPMETVPEPVPDRAAVNGRGGGAQPDSESESDSPSASSRSPPPPKERVMGRRAHGHDHPEADENPGYPTTNSDGQDGQEDSGYYEVRVEAWTTTRLRLINAGSFAPLRVSVDGHMLTLIEADGTPIEPVKVRDLVLQPAQRYSVLVSRNHEYDGMTDAFWVRARMVEDNFAYLNLALQPEARAILRYASGSVLSSPSPLPTTRPGSPATAGSKWDTEWYALPAFDEWALRPAMGTLPTANAKNESTRANELEITRADSDTDTNAPVLSIPWIFSIQRTHGLRWRSFINGTSWEVPPAGEAALVRDVAGIFKGGDGGEEGVKVWPGDQLIATLAHAQTVDFVITNLDDGDHPFHLHGYAPWLLGKGRGRYKPAKANLDFEQPMRRDVFTVPARGWAVARIVADNAGYWAFHCHIAWHMAGGGLFQVAVPPAPGEGLALPEDVVEQCRMWEEGDGVGA